MVIFLWIVVGSIVVCTAIALLSRKRAKVTLSEIAEKRERQAR
jgi:heme exporter protein D